MKIINKNVVVISSDIELEEVLTTDNTYSYIYLDSDVTLLEGFIINENKSNVVINGTYNNVRHLLTLPVDGEVESLVVSIGNEKITFKNIDIISTSLNGVVYSPIDKSYKGIIIEYNNVKFNGNILSNNPYGITKVIDSNITIENTNNVNAIEVIRSDRVIIGGNTSIYSSSTGGSLFYFRNDTTSPSLIILCKSSVTLTSLNKEVMSGTSKLNFSILHDSILNLVTANGFQSNTITGAYDVLIEERSTFSFIENKHQRIPMFAIYNSLTVREGASVSIINTYESTPTDNYNIHFKGSSPKIILDNPKLFCLYSKNANTIYSNNELTFSIKSRRINTWTYSSTFSTAGGINDLPEYSWFKSSDLISISGTLSGTTTEIISHNFTIDELSILPSLDLFNLTNLKEFSVGSSVINVLPLDSNSTDFKGYTTSYANVMISYGDFIFRVEADLNGYFENPIGDKLEDGTEVTFISNVSGSFIYEKRVITIPFDGEISITYYPSSISFDLKSISNNYISKTKDYLIRVIDGRREKNGFKLLANIDNDLTSLNGYVLENSLVFKRIDGEVITLSKDKQVIYEEESNSNILYNLNFSKDRGPLLDISNKYLLLNEEYFANINIYLEE